MEINILHLYYDILNLYGEYGNVVIMKKHLEDQGFKVSLDKKTVISIILFIWGVVLRKILILFWKI